MTHFILGTSDGLKSIPLHALPAEAWRTLGGSQETEIGALYKSVPWLYGGINKRANSVANVPYDVLRGETVIASEDDDLMLGAMPVDLRGMLNAIEGDLVMFGCAYYELGTGTRTGAARSLRRLFPPTVRPQYNKDTGALTHYERATASGSPVKYAPEELIVFRLPNRLGEVGSDVPPAIVALGAAGVLRNIDAYGQKFFTNGFLGAIVTTDGWESTTEADKERFKSSLRSMMQGVRNAFNFAVTGGKSLAIQQVGYSVRDMAMPELTATKREDIATALGVPQTMLFSNAANYATAKQDTLNFYKETILPDLQAVIVPALNRQLLSRYGYRLDIAPERLEIFQDDEMSKAAALMGLTGKPILTVNEARETLGYAPMTAEQDELPDEAETAQRTPRMASGDDEADEYMQELRTWERFATKRWKEGKPDKAVGFKTNLVPSDVALMLADALAVSENTEHIALAFREARDYVSHHA